MTFKIENMEQDPTEQEFFQSLKTVIVSNTIRCHGKNVKRAEN